MQKLKGYTREVLRPSEGQSGSYRSFAPEKFPIFIFMCYRAKRHWRVNEKILRMCLIKSKLVYNNNKHAL